MVLKHNLTDRLEQEIKEKLKIALNLVEALQKLIILVIIKQTELLERMLTKKENQVLKIAQ